MFSGLSLRDRKRSRDGGSKVVNTGTTQRFQDAFCPNLLKYGVCERHEAHLYNIAKQREQERQRRVEVKQLLKAVAQLEEAKKNRKKQQQKNKVQQNSATTKKKDGADGNDADADADADNDDDTASGEAEELKELQEKLQQYNKPVKEVSIWNICPFQHPETRAGLDACKYRHQKGEDLSPMAAVVAGESGRDGDATAPQKKQLPFHYLQRQAQRERLSRHRRAFDGIDNKKQKKSLTASKKLKRFFKKRMQVIDQRINSRLQKKKKKQKKRSSDEASVEGGEGGSGVNADADDSDDEDDDEDLETFTIPSAPVMLATFLYESVHANVTCFTADLRPTNLEEKHKFKAFFEYHKEQERKKKEEEQQRGNDDDNDDEEESEDESDDENESDDDGEEEEDIMPMTTTRTFVVREGAAIDASNLRPVLVHYLTANKPKTIVDKMYNLFLLVQQEQEQQKGGGGGQEQGQGPSSTLAASTTKPKHATTTTKPTDGDSSHDDDESSDDDEKDDDDDDEEQLWLLDHYYATEGEISFNNPAFCDSFVEALQLLHQTGLVPAAGECLRLRGNGISSLTHLLNSFRKKMLQMTVSSTSMSKITTLNKHNNKQINKHPLAAMILSQFGGEQEIRTKTQTETSTSSLLNPLSLIPPPPPPYCQRLCHLDVAFNDIYDSINKFVFILKQQKDFPELLALTLHNNPNTMTSTAQAATALALPVGAGSSANAASAVSSSDNNQRLDSKQSDATANGPVQFGIGNRTSNKYNENNYYRQVVTASLPELELLDGLECRAPPLALPHPRSAGAVCLNGGVSSLEEYYTRHRVRLERETKEHSLRKQAVKTPMMKKKNKQQKEECEKQKQRETVEEEQKEEQLAQDVVQFVQCLLGTFELGSNGGLMIHSAQSGAGKGGRQHHHNIHNTLQDIEHNVYDHYDSSTTSLGVDSEWMKRVYHPSCCFSVTRSPLLTDVVMKRQIEAQGCVTEGEFAAKYGAYESVSQSQKEKKVMKRRRGANEEKTVTSSANTAAGCVSATGSSGTTAAIASSQQQALVKIMSNQDEKDVQSLNINLDQRSRNILLGITAHGSGALSYLATAATAAAGKNEDTGKDNVVQHKKNKKKKKRDDDDDEEEEEEEETEEDKQRIREAKAANNKYSNHLNAFHNAHNNPQNSMRVISKGPLGVLAGYMGTLYPPRLMVSHNLSSCVFSIHSTNLNDMRPVGYPEAGSLGLSGRGGKKAPLFGGSGNVGGSGSIGSIGIGGGGSGSHASHTTSSGSNLFGQGGRGKQKPVFITVTLHGVMSWSLPSVSNYHHKGAAGVGVGVGDGGEVTSAAAVSVPAYPAASSPSASASIDVCYDRTLTLVQNNEAPEEGEDGALGGLLTRKKSKIILFGESENDDDDDSCDDDVNDNADEEEDDNNRERMPSEETLVEIVNDIREHPALQKFRVYNDQIVLRPINNTDKGYKRTTTVESSAGAASPGAADSFAAKVAAIATGSAPPPPSTTSPPHHHHQQQHPSSNNNTKNFIGDILFTPYSKRRVQHLSKLYGVGYHTAASCIERSTSDAGCHASLKELCATLNERSHSQQSTTTTTNTNNNSAGNAVNNNTRVDSNNSNSDNNRNGSGNVITNHNDDNTAGGNNNGEPKQDMMAIPPKIQKTASFGLGAAARQTALGWNTDEGATDAEKSGNNHPNIRKEDDDDGDGAAAAAVPVMDADADADAPAAEDSFAEILSRHQSAVLFPPAALTS